VTKQILSRELRAMGYSTLTLTVKTSLFDSSALPTTLTGSVVSVRGLQDDDRWEIVAKCNNLDGSGNPIFPLGYHFDYDNTTITIT
jgi:hypothetical protein